MRGTSVRRGEEQFMKKAVKVLFTALLTMAVLGGWSADSTGESSEDTSLNRAGTG